MTLRRSGTFARSSGFLFMENFSIYYSMEKPNFLKYVAALLIFLIVISIAVWFAWEVYGDGLIESAYNGQSLPLVNKYVSIHRSIDPEKRTLQYFIDNGKPVVPRLLSVFIALLILALSGVRNKYALVRNFFAEIAHPVNLAIFRIVLFGALLGYVDIQQGIEFSRFPADLRVAPPGLGWLLNILPIDPTLTTIASSIFIVVCLSALLGYYSRTSATLAVMVGLYVLGLPQFFGKIDHYHHLLWFAAILAASPCGDALSIDAVLASRRNRGNVPTEKSVAYALPLRFVMLLLGILYFFAGVWKFVIGGIGWATGETMRNILYAQWFRLDWVPQFRIDNYPFLYHSAGVGVVVFELVFIFAILFPKHRKYAAIAGLLFHISVYLFAHINFWTLALCYVVFIDFEPLYRRLRMTKLQNPGNGSFNRHSSFVYHKSKPPLILGITLLSINTLCGIALFDSWPFAVYPTFAAVEERFTQSLTVVLVNPDGTTTEIIPYKERALQAAIHPSRLIGLFTQVLWANDVREVEKKGNALIGVLSAHDVRFRQAKTITLYKDICSVIPEDQQKNPVRRELLIIVER